MNISDRDALRRYLLGASEALAREEIERRLFSDDEIFWERLSIAEDELIDDYATGALDVDDRGLFVSRFLATGERRARLEFARAIHAHARGRDTERHGAWDWLRSSSAVPRWAVAAAALLVLTLLPAALWRMAPGDATPAAVSVSLSPGLLRDAGAGVARVHLSEGCGVFHLDLLTGADAYPSYSATVHEVSGEPIWSQHKLSGAASDGGVSVRLTLPCGLLPENDYWIRLTGIAPGQEPASLDRYDFRLLRE
jgi:hypothetical protein